MYTLSVVTPEKTIFDGQVISLTAPGTLGYLEILTNHAPIITTLQPGKLTITDQNKNKLLHAISGGILEICHNEATILADAIEKPEEIDINRAEAALKRAQERIQSKDKKIDLARAKNAWKRAENRIKIYRQFKSITTHSPMLSMFE